MTSSPNLPTLLKHALQAQGVSPSAAARLAGLSPAALSRILNGHTQPSFANVQKLAQVLGLSLDALLHGTPAPDTTPTTAQDAITATYSLEHTDLSAKQVADVLCKVLLDGANDVQGMTGARWNAPTLAMPTVIEVQQVGTGRFTATVSFPLGWLESGSLTGLLSLLGSAMLGTGAHVQDVTLPTGFVRTFAGPALGIMGWRDTANKHGRPLLCATIRPMHGLSPKQYGRFAYEALLGGADFTADPTMLHSVPGLSWRERFRYVAEAAAAATRETNEFKAHMVNVTADSTEAMLERIAWAREVDLSAVLVDSAAIGFTAFASVAKACEKHDMLLCAMGGRALAGPQLGDALQAKLLRLAGADVISLGSPLRGNVANRRHVQGLLEVLRQPQHPAQPDAGLFQPQDFAGLNASFPAVGGNHNVWQFPRVLDAMGDDTIIQCGGAMAAHPWGWQAGAVACRTALEALVQARNEGKTLSVEGRAVLQQAAKYTPELKEALAAFEEGAALFGVVGGAGLGASVQANHRASVQLHGLNPSPVIAPAIAPASPFGQVTPFKKPTPSKPPINPQEPTDEPV